MITFQEEVVQLVIFWKLIDFLNGNHGFVNASLMLQQQRMQGTCRAVPASVLALSV